MRMRDWPLWRYFVVCTALIAVAATAGVLLYSAFTGWSDVAPRHVLGLVSPSVIPGLAATATERRRRRGARLAGPVLPERT